MQRISKFIISTIKFLKDIDSKITKQSDNINPNHYDDLAPLDNIVDDDYNDALLWALKNKKITDIALTAPYGAGKSTILRTFEKNNTDWKYLNISLATFKENDTTTKQLIEKSILQQMFYKVDTKLIPQSRFKRISKTKNILLKTIGSFLWLGAAFILLKVDFVQNLHITDIIKTIATTIFLSGSFILLYKSLKSFGTMKLSKINLKSPEIELGNETDSEISILNKHLDEVLYFFEVTEFNVVVIEDLDRFDNPEIFTTLRELNTLLNNSDQIDRKIMFIYAIKDNMFKDKSRTKFFDFIIPIIPIINTSNSLEILSKKIQETKMEDKISNQFISDIALYISDMRMLKNIYNEFMLYNSKLSTIDINLEKLFAIIVYKNIDPADFADLHDNKGKVFKVFENKKTAISDFKDELNERINEAKKELEQIKSQSLNDIQELRAVYIMEMINLLPESVKTRLNGREFTLKQLNSDVAFDLLIKETNITFQRVNYGYQHSNISFKKIEDSVNDTITYDKRANIISKKENDGIKELQILIQQTENQIQDIKSYTVKEYIESINDDKIFDETLRENKLLTYLIRYGYIDEMYHSLISYFFEGNMTKMDMDFVLSVKNKEHLFFSYFIDNPKSVLEKLRVNEFKSEEIYNFDLLNYILANELKYKDELEKFIKQLSNEKDNTIKFIDEYISKCKNIELFISKLSNQWSNMWNFIYNESTYDDEKLDNYLSLLIKYADIKDIKLQNINETLSTYISNKDDFIELITEDKYIDKIKKTIKILEIKFENIKEFTLDTKIFKYIYEGNFYKINVNMIENIIGKTFTSELSKYNYTTIIDFKKEKLIKYIEDNIEMYLEEVFFKLDNNTKESEKTVLELLKNPNISNTYKKDIIKKEDVLIGSLLDIDEELWNTIFEENKIKTTWANILEYYEKVANSTKNIIYYLNIDTNYIELSAQKIVESDKYSYELIERFFYGILLSNGINLESFKSIIKCYNYLYNDIEYEDVSEDKLKVLFDNKLIELNESNYEQIKLHFDKYHLILIEQNESVFIEDIDCFEISREDIIYLFKSSKIKLNTKAILLDRFDASLMNNESSKEIANIYLLDDFDGDIDEEKLKRLITTTNDTSTKIDIICKSIKDDSLEWIDSLLTLLGEPYTKIIESNKKPTIPNTNSNNKLLTRLREAGYILSFKEEDGKKFRIQNKKEK